VFPFDEGHDVDIFERRRAVHLFQCMIWLLDRILGITDVCMVLAYSFYSMRTEQINKGILCWFSMYSLALKFQWPLQVNLSYMLIFILSRFKCHHQLVKHVVLGAR
jgi:hypothetical protein